MGKIDPETKAAIKAYSMPKVALGTPVLWRSRKGREPQIAFVFRVSARNVHLATAMSGIKEAVRHEDDPKLRLNADQREMGAWDFTDHHKQQMKEREELLQRIEALERLAKGKKATDVDAIKASEKAALTIGIPTDRKTLVALGRELNIKNPYNMPTDDLIDAIKQVQQAGI